MNKYKYITEEQIERQTLLNNRFKAISKDILQPLIQSLSIGQKVINTSYNTINKKAIETTYENREEDKGFKYSIYASGNYVMIRIHVAIEFGKDKVRTTKQKEFVLCTTDEKGIIKSLFDFPDDMFKSFDTDEQKILVKRAEQLQYELLQVESLLIPELK